MQEVQTQPETKGKSLVANGSDRAQRRGKCGSSHKHDADTKAASSPLEILQQRFARGEIDTAEFEEKRRLITNA
jgi:hypothetical protein